MSKFMATVAISAFCGAAAVTGLALTAGKSGGKPAQPEVALAPNHPLAAMHQVDEATATAAWMAAGTPGPAHEWLGQMIGTWKTVSTMSHGGEEMSSEGTATYSWLIDGRFLKQEFAGEMMGMPMTGFGVTGFDNVKNQFVGTWLDSMGTGIYTMQGSLDPTGKIQTMVGFMDEPTTGEHGKAVMYVTTIIDQDHLRFEWKECLYGEAMTVFQIDYTRAE